MARCWNLCGGRPSLLALLLITGLWTANVAEAQDCNGNGVPDATDIATGISQDCNGNGVPDECDIAAGSSLDCNLDGIPDECQPIVVPEARIAPAGVAPLDAAGWAIDQDGSVLVIGAYLDDSAGLDAGAALVYRFDGMNWIYEAELIAADAAAGDWAGFSVAVHGDLIAVSALHDADPTLGPNIGSVTLYRFDGTAWIQEDKLVPADGSPTDFFGWQVDVGLDTLIAGSIQDDDGAADAGSAYIYHFDGTAWSLESKLVAADAAAGADFGSAVAIDGNRAIVGAYLDPNAPLQSGSAYIFDRSAGVWSQSAKLVATDGQLADLTGNDVALSGDLALVGSRANDAGGIDRGAAYVYRFDGISWVAEAKLLSPTPADNDGFGWSVAIDGNVLVVGAPGDDSAANAAGAVYAFRYDGTSWAPQVQVLASDAAAGDLFGTDISLGLNELATGAPQQDTPAVDGGAAYVHELPFGPDCNVNGIDDACDISSGISADCNLNGVPDECESTAPVFTMQPQSQAVCTGASVTLSVAVTGLPPFSFEWEHDGVELPGGADTYTIASFAAADSGSYVCRVIDSCGTSFSAPAVLTLQPSLSVLGVTPLAPTICEGDALALTVDATGAGPLGYQWLRNGLPIPGATASAFSIASATTGDAGLYSVQVSDACATATSAPTTLTVETIATITTQPTPQSVCDGGAASFSVAATAVGPLNYQWRKGGIDIAGATSPALLIDPVVPGDAGSYDCAVTTPCGTVLSSVAPLDVLALPAIAVQPAGVTLCAGGSALLAVTATGATPLAYQWQRDGVDLIGATAAGLSLTGVTPAEAGSYTCVVTNACGSITSAPALVTVQTAPTITLSPAGSSPCQGDLVVLSVGAIGSGPLAFQWRHDGVELPGETASSLNLGVVTPAASGSYDCVVTNGCGSATSAAALVSVRTPPAIGADPTGGTPCEGDLFTLSIVASGSAPLTYQWQKDGTDVPGASAPSFTLHPIDHLDTGLYSCVVSNSCGTTTSAAAAVDVRVAPAVTSPPSGGTLCVGGAISLSVTASGTGPLAYAWRRDGIDLAGATGSSLTLTGVTPAEAGSYDCVVSNDCGSVTSAAAVVTIRTPPVVAAGPASQSPCSGDLVTLSVTASGSAPLAYQWRRNGLALAAATGATLTLDPVAASDSGSYDCVVSNDCGSATSSSASVDVQLPPSVVTGPAPGTPCAGDLVKLAVVAQGSAPLVYQWRRDGVDLLGETSATLVLAGVSPADTGSYSCAIENPCGAVVSAGALLDVRIAPTVTADPVDAAPCAGDLLTLSVSATGSAPLSYQWSRDGVALPGATGPSLTLNPVGTADTGSYDCSVSNDCGSAASATAIVTVRVAPSIASSPVDATLCEGSVASLSVAATGSAPLAYQWRRNGIALPGAATDTLTLSPAVATDSGSYDCVVSNDCGSATSAAAQVLVEVPPALFLDPVGGSPCAGSTVVLTVAAEGSAPVGFQWRRDGVALPGATSATLTLSPVGTGDSGTYDCVVSNPCGEATSAGALLDVRSAPVITLDPASAAPCQGGILTLEVLATGSAPLAYQWRRDGVELAGQTAPSLTLNPVAVEDAGSYDCVASNDCGASTSAAAAVSVQTPPSVTQDPVSGTPCAGDLVTLTVVATGSGPLSYQWQRDGLDLSGATGTSLTLNPVTASDSGSYACVVSNACGTAISAAALLAVQLAPTIEADPLAASACDGDIVTFSLSASGSGVLTYQWRRDGVDIPGATASLYTLNPVGPADAGSYDCVVTNECGSATSSPAPLTVSSAPLITTGPESTAVCLGEPLQLSITADGAAPLSYQWRKDGADIAGAISATFSIVSATLADTGSYDCVVANACGTVVSAVAIATVEDCAPIFIRGDSNGDGIVDLADAIHVIQWQFQGGTATCHKATDANDDGTPTIGDAIWLLSYIFNDGLAPWAPFPDCGTDPTPDSLTCESYSGCL